MGGGGGGGMREGGGKGGGWDLWEGEYHRLNVQDAQESPGNSFISICVKFQNYLALRITQLLFIYKRSMIGIL